MRKLSVNLIYFFMSIIIGLVILVTIYKRQNELISSGFSLKGKEEVILNLYDNYTDEGFVAILNNSDYSKKVIVSSNLNSKKAGEYDITYELKIPFASSILKRKIKVIDNIKPVLKVESDDNIYFVVNTNYKIPKSTAVDNCDGDITSNIKVTNNIDIRKKGKYYIDYYIKDSSGNESSKRINVHITDKYDHTYIDISIKNQKLLYYKNNELIFSSDVTTGINGKTIPGRYKILSKTRNTYLTTKKYNVFVKYWIAYSGNVYGLHDASWRKKFGGNEYIYNGSNGCVNLPSSSAKYIYENADIGTPVIIHY